MRDAFARTIYDIARSDPKTFVVVADISPAAAMAPFLRDFPDQFINVGLAEQAMISLCAGLALRGCTPFAYTIATFSIYRPFEQVRDDLCYQNLPVTIVGVGAGVSYSLLGSTHHAQEDVAIMGGLPNMSILAPCDPAETVLAAWACAKHAGPVYLRLGKAGEPDLTANAIDPFVFGKLRRVTDGSDVCILGYGPILKTGFDVAKGLEARGCSVSVVSAHTVKPLDEEGMAALFSRFEHVIVIEETSVRGSLGTDVKRLAWERRAACQVHTFALKDEFLHIYGAHQDLLRAHGLTAAQILESLGDLRPSRTR
ncbi:MAG: transketolase C-terminal domain-containing protein [Vicinamibacterales bacterium]